MQDELTLNEAVNYMMKLTGKTRREAKAALVEAFRKGNLKLQAHGPNGEIVEVPKEIFQGVIRDDEGQWYGTH